MTKKTISILILTYNEESNLPACLNSLSSLDAEIFIVDSHSTDATVEIAKRYGANVYPHDFTNQARQVNWAIENLPMRGDWVLRLDADERLTPQLSIELSSVLTGIREGVNGLYCRRRVLFMGRWIRHGGYYPTWLLRVWRRGKAVCEERWMDEHMILTGGRPESLLGDISEDNRKDLSWWISKHNSYATREMIEFFRQAGGLFVNGKKIEGTFLDTQEKRKRWLKNSVYNRLPLFFRPFMYFLYRYFLRFGFLDGREGLVFHFLQGFWYRFLVDAKIYEFKIRARKEGKTPSELLKDLYGID